MNTDQIAAEAARDVRSALLEWAKIVRYVIPLPSTFDQGNTIIIKSAIEEAIKPWRDAIVGISPVSEKPEKRNDILAEVEAKETGDSRAAHSSEFFVCNKCGYAGSTQKHEGCNYLATPAHASEWTDEKLNLLARETFKRIADQNTGLDAVDIIQSSFKRICESRAAHASEPQSFTAALNDFAEQRVVDMDLALTQPPPQSADTKRGIEEQILKIIDKYNEAEDVPAVDALRDIEALVR